MGGARQRNARYERQDKYRKHACHAGHLRGPVHNVRPLNLPADTLNAGSHSAEWYPKWPVGSGYTIPLMILSTNTQERSNNSST